MRTGTGRGGTAQDDPGQDDPGQDDTVQITTEGGPALAEIDGDGAAARFLLVLTHGAGGSAEQTARQIDQLLQTWNLARPQMDLKS